MQLQHERDHFVHSGIGGGSSSSSASSPSCSPPKDSPLSLIKVNNLKMPKTRLHKDTPPKSPRVTSSTAAAAASAAKPSPCALDPSLPVTFGPAAALDGNDSNSSNSSITRSSKESSGNSKDAALHPQHRRKDTPISPIHFTAATHAPPPPPPSTPTTATSTTTTTTSITTTTRAIAAKNRAAPRPHQQLPLSSWTASRPCPGPASSPVLHSATDTLLQRTLAQPHPPPQSCSLAGLNASGPFLQATDRLSRLPSELLFNVLCLLDALELTRVAQTSKLCARMASDNGVWRVKSMQHPLYSPRHVQDQQRTVPWLAYYKFLHRNSLAVKQNWTDARPQAVHVLEGHTGLVSSLEMSLWTLVTASIDQTLRVWDLRTMQCVQVLHARQSLTCVSQSESAGVACARTSFGGLCLWDIRTGELILQDDSAMPQIASFIFMNETYIGYGQCDGVVTIFDWSSRKELEVVGTYQAHEGDVIHINILANKYVISASTNGETLVYSLAESRIIERILLPHATQAIQFTPTIHGDKAMFSTRDAIYEYELMLGHLSHKSGNTRDQRPAVDVQKRSAGLATADCRTRNGNLQGASPEHFAAELPAPTHRAAVNLQPITGSSTRPVQSPGRIWKTSNSLLSQIRQRVGTEKAFDLERPNIPTRFPRLASIYCLPRQSRTLDHGTTSARDSYGIFMPHNCTHLSEMSVYTRTLKQMKQIHGPAVDATLREALRNRFYTTMECNQHCAVVSSGSKVYIISFLPPDL